jgi:hypothetical protein
MAYQQYTSGPYAHGHGYLCTCYGYPYNSYGYLHNAYGYPYNGAPHQSSNGSPYQSAGSTAPVNNHLAAGDYTNGPNFSHSGSVTQSKSEPVDDNNVSFNHSGPVTQIKFEPVDDKNVSFEYDTNGRSNAKYPQWTP